MAGVAGPPGWGVPPPPKRDGHVLPLVGLVVLLVLGGVGAIVVATRDGGGDQGDRRTDASSAVGASGNPEPDLPGSDGPATDTAGNAKISRLCATIGAAEFAKLIPGNDGPKPNPTVTVTGYARGGCYVSSNSDPPDGYYQNLSVTAEWYGAVDDGQAPESRCQAHARHDRQSRRDNLAAGQRLEAVPELGANAFVLVISSSSVDGGQVILGVCHGVYYLQVRYSVLWYTGSVTPAPERTARGLVAFTQTVLSRLQA
jgi:hypothetical protein